MRSCGSSATAQVLLLPRLAQELSCCLQDTQLRRRPAKLLLRNALGPELRCCLQDCADAVSDPGASAAGDSGRPLRDVPCGTASSNPDGGLAIFGGCRGTPRGTQDRRRSSVGGIRCDAFSGMPVRRRPTGEAETSKAERTSGNSGSAVPPYSRCRIPCMGEPAATVRYRADLETAVECIPRPRQCHHCEQLQNRGNCGCFKPGLTFGRRYDFRTRQEVKHTSTNGTGGDWQRLAGAAKEGGTATLEIGGDGNVHRSSSGERQESAAQAAPHGASDLGADPTRDAAMPDRGTHGSRLRS